MLLEADFVGIVWVGLVAVDGLGAVWVLDALLRRLVLGRCLRGHAAELRGGVATLGSCGLEMRFRSRSIGPRCTSAVAGCWRSESVGGWCNRWRWGVRNASRAALCAGRMNRRTCGDQH